MDKFVIRELRTGVEFPQGNQMIAFPTNATGSNMIPPETMYLSGPFAAEFLNGQQNMGAQHDMDAQHNMGAQNSMHIHHNTGVYQNMSSNMGVHQKISPLYNFRVPQNLSAQRNLNNQHNMAAQHTINGQHNTDTQHTINIQHNMVTQHTTNNQHNMNAQHAMTMNVQRKLDGQHRMGVQHNINPQMSHTFGQNPVAGQDHISGIDSNYLAGYADNSARFIATGQQIQRNATPITGNCSFGSDYQNRSFNGIDRNKQKSFSPQTSIEPSRVGVTPRAQPQQMVFRNSNKENTQHNSSVLQPKKPNELDLPRNDIQNQIVTRADKLKALHKSGPRVFSGPVEKVLKWHKSLQDVGLLIFYEIVAKCVSVRPGESGSKVLVVRDDSGPAMQVVYYEIDFLLPELKVPCTVRVIGKMVAGTCQLQAFNVRPASGDDVATLPRRAAVAAHHVAKLCKEYGPIQ